MSDYSTAFSKRSDSYKYAIQKYPNALHEELETAANFVLKTNPCTVLNMMAGGINIEPFLPKNVQYIAFESNPDLASTMNIQHCSIDGIPLMDQSVDTILCLSSLHHANTKQRLLFYKECLRVLKKNGALILGDVLKGSAQDAWLNVFVNTYNSCGHDGLFMCEEDKDLLYESGFQTIHLECPEYSWVFDDTDSMIDFSKHLFGLDKADKSIIEHGIDYYLHPEIKDDAVVIPWKLIYFICRK